MFNENKLDLIDFNKILSEINKKIEDKNFSDNYDENKDEYINLAKNLYNLS
jgi:hypothetical protein